MEADFSGYVTKAGLKCSDGRTITAKAFEHMDGKKVPLVYQHGHDNAENILGHVLLEKREDGVYGYAFLNKQTPQGVNAQALVQHEDITMFSIYANQLVERSKKVLHGMIREVSLVLSGANPGALIDPVSIRHSDDDVETLDDEAIIYTGLSFEHAEGDSGSKGKTVKDVYNEFTDEQKEVVAFMIGAALEAKDGDDDASHSDLDDEDDEDDDSSDGTLNHTERNDMTRNVFEKNATGATSSTGSAPGERIYLSHDDLRGIAADAVRRGSFKEAVNDYALQHGIDDIELLFPEARELNNTPEFLARRMEWVAGVMSGTRKSPFAKVRTTHADITGEEARALGYIKGNFKKEEFFSLARRSTGPTTVIKKQTLHRDDVTDITDFDVVAWMRAEMRVMIEEELARAILVGDGRPVMDPTDENEPNPDKIRDPQGENEGTGIRSILHDDELYAHPVEIDLGEGTSADYQNVVDTLLLERKNYRGTGQPTLYTTQDFLTRMLLVRDGMGRRLWRTKADLASELSYKDIVPVEVMESEAYEGVIGIVVNLVDYVIGTNKGGELTNFDDFDIDYNKLKYLIETRLSGALVKLKSALVLREAVAEEPPTGG